MDTKHLIDSIVRQTTVLVAQLSTAAGIRAPLAHIADQVFLDLSKELESQGVSRKVVADMFGLVLRGYQKKVQRLTESQTASGQTLWLAIHEYLQKHGSITRRRLRDEVYASLVRTRAQMNELWERAYTRLVNCASRPRLSIFRARSTHHSVAGTA